jgi:hypothetical protein
MSLTDVETLAFFSVARLGCYQEKATTATKRLPVRFALDLMVRLIHNRYRNR